ncbi:uncharacterized protein LOC143215451 [Lasioglossum baleicum]|uniref:uncharacterized protein LOC143215451 n=1 Tax=Lasioglossum baleicum TaxID=434251 RepID=UPI003FCEC05C
MHNYCYPNRKLLRLQIVSITCTLQDCDYNCNECYVDRKQVLLEAIVRRRRDERMRFTAPTKLRNGSCYRDSNVAVDEKRTISMISDGVKIIAPSLTDHSVSPLNHRIDRQPKRHRIHTSLKSPMVRWTRHDAIFKQDLYLAR